VSHVGGAGKREPLATSAGVVAAFGRRAAAPDAPRGLTAFASCDFTESVTGPTHSYMTWYYAVGSERRGPFPDGEFQQHVASGAVTATTLVWRQGMASWQPYADVAGAEGAGVASGTPGALPPVAAAPAATVPFEFTGKAGEYFGIWIVNLLLTILTLGIYSAWAKVRNRRYFYSNTRLLGHAFEYTGDPVRILIGNLIVFGMAVVYFTSGAISPFLVLLVIVLFLAFFPWLLVKSLAFNARNSVYRGLRFGFDGRYGGAAGVFLGYPIIAVMTMYLLLPWALREQKNFIVRNHRYGATRFNFGGSTGEMYKIFLQSMLFYLPLVGAYIGMIAMMIAMGAGRDPGSPPPQPDAAFGLFGLFFIPALFLAVIGRYFYVAKVFNYTWNNTSVGAHRFSATMKVGQLVAIQLVNAIVVLFTLGFMYPWAKVRVARFTLSNLFFHPVGDVDAFVAGATAEESAVGEAASDFFDFDIGFGL
jgi:uncharacterized membrane protein YjgN (DUF898 family)